MLLADTGWVGSLFLVVLGGKLWLISRFGSSIPFLDQWDADGAYLFVPLLEGSLRLGDLFAAHNEHRILLSRLYNLVLFLVNGQWDNQVQAVANAFIHSGFGAGLGLLLSRLLSARWWPLIWLTVASTLVLPFSWENTLAGFQAPFYFLLVLSVLVLWWLGFSPIWSLRWWGGVTAGILALFTLASGFLAPASVLVLAAVRTLKRSATWRAQAPTACVCLGLVFAGFLLKVDVPEHEVLRAHSLAEFGISLARSLAWPWIVLPAYAAVNLLPLALLGWHWHRATPAPVAYEAVGVGAIWTGLQVLAIAFARGAGGHHPGWRYMDIISLLFLAIVMSIVLTFPPRTAPRRLRTLYAAGTGLWTLLAVTGMALLTARAWSVDIPERVVNQRYAVRNAREFLAHKDDRLLLGKPAWALPYPRPAKLAELLSNPRVARILPTSIRNPLPLAPDEPACAGFGLADEIAPSVRSAGPIWTSQHAEAQADFLSLPIRKPEFPFLEISIWVSGPAGQMSVRLEDTVTGKTTAAPLLVSDETGWQKVFVKSPAHPFRVRIEDREPGAFLMLMPLREAARFSVYGVKLAACGSAFMTCGLCLAAATLVLWAKSRPVRRS